MRKSVFILGIAVMSLLFAVALSASEEDEEISVAGGFKIATPPLGYPYYTDSPDATRNRIMLGYTRYDNDMLDMHGVSLHLLNRLSRGEWGAVSLKYGGFYAGGQELDAVQTYNSVTGEWESDGDFDLTVYGGELELLLEIAAVNRGAPGEWGFKLIPYTRLDTGFQAFEQETADAIYSSIILGGTLGMQGHISAPGGGMFSPFFGATALTAISTADGVEPGILLWPSYGFDIIYRSFSLSGIVQPLMGPAGNYTASIGFEW